MARRNRQTDDLERDDDLIANLLAPVTPQAPLRSPGYTTSADLFQEIEDRRTFHPEALFRPPMDVAAKPAGYRRQQNPNATRRGNTIHNISFDAPQKALVCVRRKTRREVIFAKKKHRKGAGSGRRRNFLSNIRC